MNLSAVNKYLIPCLFILAGLYSEASPDADSLFTVIRSKNDPAEKVILLSAYCDNYRGADTALLNRYCNELTDLASKISQAETAAEANRVAGNIFGKHANYDKAFTFLNKAIDQARRIQSPKSRLVLARSLLNLATLYHQSGDFEPALNLYFEAESIFETQHDKPGLIRVYNGLGDLYDKLIQPEKRKAYNEKAYKLAAGTDDPDARCKAYTGVATNLANEGKYSEAISLYTKTLETARQINDRHIEHTLYYDLGFTYSQMENYPKALEMYQKSLEVARENHDASDEGDALYKIGLTWYYSQNLPKSREILFQAMEIAERLKSKILKRNILDVLYSVEETAGDYKKAYGYLNQYVDIIYEIFSQEDQQQSNFLNAKYQAASREHQIKELEAEKQIQHLKMRRQQTWIASLTTIIISILILSYLLMRNVRYKRKISRQEVEMKEQRIQELEKERQLIATKSVLQGEEAERTRLANDLHDGLGGLLSGVKINLSNMKENAVLTSENLTAFNHALGLLDTSISELRRIAHNMMPETLIHYGLKTALQDFISQTGTTPAIKFSFFGEDFRYSNEVELTIYRITQELVSNALKHSRAQNILVQLFAETDRLCVQVTDDGIGFDQDNLNKPEEGKGLRNIRDRVHALNGKFDINSQAGGGTEIIAEISIP